MNNNYGLIKPFGPSIFKAKIPEELLRYWDFAKSCLKN